MTQLAFLKIFILTLLMVLNVTVQAQPIENFDNIGTLQNDGWIFDNQSDNPTKINWFQGIDSVFPAQSGAPTSYIANTTATGNNVICSWLIMPDIGSIEQLSFFTRSQNSANELTRMLVMYSPTGSINTGTCESQQPLNTKGLNDFGDFQQLLAINPNQDLDGYPKTWTQYTVDVNGSGRVAFLFYVTGTGVAPFNSGLLAIDSVSAGAAVGSSVHAVPLFNSAGLFILLLILVSVTNLFFKNAFNLKSQL